MRKKGTKFIAELELIARIRKGAADQPSQTLALGIGDDCAILHPGTGQEIVITTDFSMEGRHFLRNRHPAESVGHRVLARGLSDLAAMGARPIAAFLSLALPANMPRTAAGRRWIDGFSSGFHRLARRHQTPLAGGDTSESPCGLVLADVVLVGSVRKGRSLRRSGARPGEMLYVTGSLGGAAAELRSVLAGRKIAGRGGDHPHLFPQPRIEVGRELVRRGIATACIDLSDGLSTDLAHLCSASGIRAEIQSYSLPIHPLAVTFEEEDRLDVALNGGEDYELLFAAPATRRVPHEIAGVKITRIGQLLAPRRGGKLVTLIGPHGERRELKQGGWQHFTGSTKQRSRGR
jgi:thiamine-monophosphate kinase